MKPLARIYRLPPAADNRLTGVAPRKSIPTFGGVQCITGAWGIFG